MQVQEIALARIAVSESNIRKDLEAGTSDSGLDDLAASISDRGLLSPVTVRPRPDGTYDLIAGQRRFLACHKLGWDTIPAIIRDVDDDTDATVLSLIENVHRADLNPLDKARAYEAILKKVGDPAKVAKETGVSAPTVKKYLSLLMLAPDIQASVGHTEGSAGIGALSRIGQDFQPEEQGRVLDMIGGFRQDIQLEMMRRSGGDVDALAGLRRQALEGAFDTRVCRGLEDCTFIPSELANTVMEALDKYRRDADEDSFVEVVRQLRS